ncbi:hypothetical protein [Williamsia serinedens]|uniref:DUF222 domain-containing protein n=1 Tax=Williamsia serinedens TaxID=391736 RepID=A0ABT1H615_9NOCA|nr:hypothetical protein [Williamsia serinedens]MCP2162675.1 hypothetical protein [Williamsia serinedens]
MTTPTRAEIETASLVLAKIATADQWAAKPDAAMAITWAECFAVHGLQRDDLLAGVVRLYADDKRDRSGRTLPADVIAQARKLRQDRQEREKARLEGLPSVRELSPERRAILACDRCDPNGWLDIAETAVKCTHGRELE